eukprot:CAMPEP_0172919996 /NCGR_PEP_ID=MMETSP1075-20121228/203184_1 /TAXON_ID=2916 /ORGANISM="Ceratium fusus, Strain PA161109" /LENGTH=48 /DNA_ID= /DNA_START= /DNA_END= /DNA_ORIENTATION=
MMMMPMNPTSQGRARSGGLNKSSTDASTGKDMMATSKVAATPTTKCTA